MACFSPEKPEARRYDVELQQTFAGQKAIAPELLALEQQYQPEYARLAGQNLNILAPEVARAGNQSRAITLEGIMAALPQFTAAQRAADPGSAGLLDKLTAQANADLDAGGDLSPEQQRAMTQASRSAMAARGLGGSNIAIADELYRLYDLGNEQRRQRQQFASGVVGLNKSWQGDPMSYLAALGQGNVNMAGNLMPTNQFNPESAYAGNLYNANAQMDALFAQPSTMAKLGQTQQYFHNEREMFRKEVQTTADLMSSIMGAGACWIARAVYGDDNPRWELFRIWLFTEAPGWFFRFYLRHGPALGPWLRKPGIVQSAVRPLVRRWMDARIATLNPTGGLVHGQ